MAWVYLVGAAISAVSQIQQSRAQADSMEAQADAAEVQAQNENMILEQNAKIQERGADAIDESGKEQSELVRARGAELVAASVVGFAKGGVLGSGTAAAVVEKNEFEVEAEADMVRRNAFIESAYQRSLAANTRLQGAAALSRGQFTASNLKAGASSVKTGGYLSAGGTLLSGAGGYASMKGSALTKTGSASGVSQTSRGPTPSYRTR